MVYELERVEYSWKQSQSIGKDPCMLETPYVPLGGDNDNDDQLCQLSRFPLMLIIFSN